MKYYENLNKLNTPTKPSNTTASLKLEELDFKPWCNITTKEAVSAIHRAKTQFCKKELVDVICSLQKETLFPKKLVSFCPAPGVQRGKSLGCYQDNKSMRLLSGYFANLEQMNSPENCINLCLQSGFPYAGVEFWTECFCGVDEPSSKARLPDSSCNMKCPTDPKLACGGYLTMNIYETGIKKFIPQVPSTEVTTTEPRVRITFLLTFSGRALRQIKRLIKSLFHKDHYFLIHVDATQDYLFREKNENLVNFLTANKGKNFVKSTGREIQRFIQKQGLDKTFVQCDGHMWRIGDRKLPLGIQMDGGSDWMALSRSFVEYVAGENRDELLRGLDRVYQYTLLPAESYFHTVLRNSKFCDTYVDNNLHLTNWKRHLGCKCQYRHIVDWCGCSPNDFKPEDWQKISVTSSNHLYFARKFEAIINQAIINKLEEWVYGPSIELTKMLGYWQSMYHFADLTPARDDSVLSLLSSLGRNVIKQNNMKISIKDVIEITSYHHDDIFQGLLMRYSAYENETKKEMEFETWLKIKSHFELIDKKNGQFIQDVKVASDFDLKESVSRNLIGNLGLFSDVIVVYTVTVEKNYNLTFLIVDPAGQLAQVLDARIEEKTSVCFSKASIPTPLLPGIWQVKVYHDGFLVAETEFLVIPMEFIASTPVTLQQASLLHRGSSEYRISVDKIHWSKSLESNKSKHSLALANQKRIGTDLKEWIDSLTNKFYTFVETCQVLGSGKLTGSYKNLEPCEATIWSSLSPDLKSRISFYDPKTGILS
ncbi:Xylosyltransferase oxt, putative [Pediculus humanus corporis]|uniref:protein xylosyltransferase n=1 Tax=Pediculus humanus subsp. corporis TaxID=121224 RepID=E0VGK8_PEDHC|nr:Xylosyltransferase oxt, putative [Pediculus humanus corporis]EEB12514.1 Xylosyltransferase oxt, putative [Pediculus humanus corporis]